MARRRRRAAADELILYTHKLVAVVAGAVECGGVVHRDVLLHEEERHARVDTLLRQRDAVHCDDGVGAGRDGGADVGRPVLVLYDGTTSSERALVTAAAIAHEDHKNLVVAIVTAEDGGTERLSEEALSILGSLGIRARVAALPAADVTQVLTALGRERCRTLVVGIGSTVFQGVTPAELIERSRCPVVIVR